MLAKQVGQGQPIAFVDLAAVDQNCEVLLAWSRANRINWRPAYKTLQSPELLAYVVGKLDRPRVLIHHLRNLDQALPVLPAHTDFLMGYPPTVGELAAYLRGPRPRREKPYTLRINIDSLSLLDVLLGLVATRSAATPVDLVIEIDNGGPRGGIQPGADLGVALGRLRSMRDRLRVGALLCYDVTAAGQGDAAFRKAVASYAQAQLRAAVEQIRATAADFIEVDSLILNGPGSANYPNWAGGPANEFSAGSAILFANYLDSGFPTAGLSKALYLCAPVLRLPKNVVFDFPHPPAGYEFAFIKAGGWPTGNNPTLSALVYPPNLQEVRVYGLVPTVPA